MPTAASPKSSLVKTIRQTVVIPASPDQVYEALINPKILAAFTDSPATGKGRVGSRFTAWGGYIFGVHRELVSGARIVSDWSTTEWPEGASVSRLELTLKPVAQGARLQMVHSNVPASQADSYRQGWIDFYWSPLKAYFAARAVAERPAARQDKRAAPRKAGM